MSLPRIAIVGRPNVGKSSLLNMLARAKVSIVDPTPGVTRDRVSIVVELDDPLRELEPRLAEITDTGGYGVYVAEGGRFDDAGEDLTKLTKQIEQQIGAAVERADLILFVVDAQTGLTTLDETIAQLLRERVLGGEREVPIQVVANKVDSTKWEPHAYEAAGLGMGDPWLVSAQVNYNRRLFREGLWNLLHKIEEEQGGFASELAPPEMRIALVGRRNAGKSSFINALAGEERVIVSEIAGTTRDAVDVRFEIDGRALVAIDTAGVRKRTKFADAIEHFANMRMNASIDRADVTLLLIDATENISGVDKRLGRQIADAFKPCVIVVTKWDLAAGRKGANGKPITVEDYRKYIEEELPGQRYAPILFTSSEEKVGLRETAAVAFDLLDQARTRMPTAEVNRVIRGILEGRGPSSRLGTLAKIFYVSQVTVQPPTIVMIVNKPELFFGQYEKYLLNRLHELTPFTEVPIRLIFRERKRADINDLLSGKHRGEQRRKRAAEVGDEDTILNHPGLGPGFELGDGDWDMDDDE